MLSPKQNRRAQKTIVFIVLGLVIYYFAVFQPLTQRAEQADKPLRALWDKLAKMHLRGAATKLDLNEMNQQLRQQKAALSAVERAQQRVFASVDSESAARLKNHEPFQLVDFQIEKLLRIEELGRAAKQSNVVISASVFTNFPDYRADRGTPELLWGQLAFTDQLLQTAIRCKVASVQNLDLPLCSSYSRTTNDLPFLYEIPIRLELKGSMESISKLLASLPLRAEETTAAKLPDAPPGKPALFVHRFILTKSSPENPDEARLDLRACGFIYRE